MGAKSRMTAVELVEVTAPASAPRGLSAPRAARSPSGTEPGSPRRRWGRATGRVLVVAVLALAASGIVLANRIEGVRRAAAVDRLVAAGTYLADVGPGVGARWRAESVEGGSNRGRASDAQVLAVVDGVVVMVTEDRGSQLVVARSLDSGAELWRSTFALGLGSSQCLGPEHAQDAPVVVCALRARPRVAGRDDGGTAFHVRDVRTGELLAERFAADALVGMRLVDGDVLGAWLDAGALEVRREDAVTGEARWRLPLETLDTVQGPTHVGARAAGGELVVATERDIFSVAPDGTVAFSLTTAPPRQPRRLDLRPAGEGSYVVWRNSEGTTADLLDASGRVRIAAIGIPGDLVSDDGSLGTVVFARHPDGDLLWDVAHRAKLWNAGGNVDAALVTDGVLAIEVEAGVRVVDPRRGVTLWRAPAGTRLVGVSRELVALQSGDLVGFESRSGREVWREPTGLAGGARFVIVGGQLFALEPRLMTYLAD